LKRPQALSRCGLPGFKNAAAAPQPRFLKTERNLKTCRVLKPVSFKKQWDCCKPATIEKPPVGQGRAPQGFQQDHLTIATDYSIWQQKAHDDAGPLSFFSIGRTQYFATTGPLNL
jgi:hypothetical protein